MYFLLKLNRPFLGEIVKPSLFWGTNSLVFGAFSLAGKEEKNTYISIPTLGFCSNKNHLGRKGQLPYLGESNNGYEPIHIP